MLSEEEWFKFANGGYHHPVEVFRLPSSLSGVLRCSSTIVRLDPKYARKLTFKHGLALAHYCLMEPTGSLGSALLQSTNKLVFHHYFEHIDALMELGVKAVPHNNELWICTFHKQTYQEMYRKRRKYKVLRT